MQVSLVLVADDDNRETSTTWPSVGTDEEDTELVFHFLYGSLGQDLLR